MNGAALPILLAAQLLGGPEANTEEGAEHFAAGRLEEALLAFARARDAHPDAAESDLNIAGVHYRLGEAAPPAAPGASGASGASPFAEAVRGYQAGLEGVTEAAKRRDGFFNLGNALYRGGAFREAAGAFAEAIALDPEDREARQNLELALRRAEQEEQGEEQREEESRADGEPEQQQDQEGDGEQQPREEEGQGEGNPEPRQGEPEDGEEPEGDSAPEPGTPEPPSDPGEATPEESAPGEVPEISPEQAERILAALAGIERAWQEEQLEQRRARALRRGRH